MGWSKLCPPMFMNATLPGSERPNSHAFRMNPMLWLAKMSWQFDGINPTRASNSLP